MFLHLLMCTMDANEYADDYADYVNEFARHIKRNPEHTYDTLIVYATVMGHVSFVSHLIMTGTPDRVNTTDRENSTLLHLACSLNNVHMVNMLLNCNADVNRMNSVYATPLTVSVFNNNCVLVKLLLQNSAQVNEQTLRLGTVIDDTQIVKMLLNAILYD